MTRIIALGLLAMTLAGCNLSGGPLAEIPDELLTCSRSTTWRRGGTQRDAAGHFVDLRAAHGDCFGKLGAVRAIARPGQ